MRLRRLRRARSRIRLRRETPRRRPRAGTRVLFCFVLSCGKNAYPWRIENARSLRSLLIIYLSLKYTRCSNTKRTKRVFFFGLYQDAGGGRGSGVSEENIDPSDPAASFPPLHRCEVTRASRRGPDQIIIDCYPSCVFAVTNDETANALVSPYIYVYMCTCTCE